MSARRNKDSTVDHDSELFLGGLVLDKKQDDDSELYDVVLEGAKKAWGKKSFVVARWRDPFSRKGPKTKCVKWCKPWPGAKICCGHAYKWKYLECKLVVTVAAPDETDIEAVVKSCLQKAAIVGALAAILAAVATGGAALAAAIGAFESAFIACVVHEISDAIVRVDKVCKWTDWRS